MSKKTKLILIISSVFGNLILLGAIFLSLDAYRSASQNSDYGEETVSYDTDDFESVAPTASGLKLEAAEEDIDSDDKVIKTGYISIEAKDIPGILKSVLGVVNTYGGKVISESDSGEGSDRRVRMDIKVSEEDYLDAYNDLKALDGKLIYSSSSQQDVTEEYVDLLARLKNLESAEKQLTEILKTAESVEDTLAVYTELTSIRGQIESLEGRIKYLNNQTDFSTISLNISQSSTGISIDEEKWEPLGILKTAGSALVGFIIILANLLIWIVVFSPIVLVPVGIFWVLKKKKKK